MATILPNAINKITQVDVRQDVAKYADGLNKKGKVVTSDEALFITSARKKVITGELLNIIKDSAFDCALNYADNIKDSPGIVCLDYSTKDRDEYLYTPGLDDTMEIIDTKQEITISDQYTKIKIKDTYYYYNTYPGADGKIYLYDESLMTKTRRPKPIGRVELKNGKRAFGFFEKKAEKTHQKNTPKNTPKKT